MRRTSTLPTLVGSSEGDETRLSKSWVASHMLYNATPPTFLKPDE